MLLFGCCCCMYVLLGGTRCVIGCSVSRGPTPASIKEGDESGNLERPGGLELEGEPVGVTVRMCCASQLERE